jgi:hypothetical protein
VAEIRWLEVGAERGKRACDDVRRDKLVSQGTMM